VAALGFSSQPARADVAAREKLARELMQLMGETDVGAHAAAGLLSQMREVFPTVPDETWAELASTFETKELVDLTVGIYVKHFDESELSALIEFYRSEIGRMLIERTPAVMDEIALTGNDWAQRKALEIVEKLQAAGHQPQGM
jgi:hypothetical protein